MEQKNYKLVIDGNSFYEIDVECVKQKKKRQEEALRTERAQKRQRG